MKKFTFSYVTSGGVRDKVHISARNQGIAIARFKQRKGCLKILKIEKEK